MQEDIRKCSFCGQNAHPVIINALDAIFVQKTSQNYGFSILLLVPTKFDTIQYKHSLFTIVLQ